MELNQVVVLPKDMPRGTCLILIKRWKEAVCDECDRLMSEIYEVREQDIKITLSVDGDRELIVKLFPDELLPTRPEDRTVASLDELRELVHEEKGDA
jgi:hypothetical protein